MSRAPGLRRKGCRQQPLWQKQPSPQARPPSLQIMQKSFTDGGHSRHAIEKWYICCVAAPAGSSSSSFRRDALRGDPQGSAPYFLTILSKNLVTMESGHRVAKSAVAADDL